MARQDGLDEKLGTLGNVTYYKSGGQHLTKRKGGVSGDRIAKDPKFRRLREHMAEFAKAAQAGKLLRSSLAEFTKNVGDRIMTSRLTKAMLGVVKSDPLNVRGERTILLGDIELLKGFAFNQQTALNTVLSVQLATSIDRVTGKLGVSIPAFLTEKMLTAPIEATHFRIFAAAVEVDFNTDFFKVESASTDLLSIRELQTPAVDLTSTLTPNSTFPLFLVVGVEFLMKEHDKYYGLNNGAYNALDIVHVKGK